MTKETVEQLLYQWKIRMDQYENNNDDSERIKMEQILIDRETRWMFGNVCPPSCEGCGDEERYVKSRVCSMSATL